VRLEGLRQLKNPITSSDGGRGGGKLGAMHRGATNKPLRKLRVVHNIVSDERIGLSFTIAAGPRQRSQSQVRVPRDSLSHCTVSNSRLPPTWRAR
jgi:hypothetical protein